MLLQLEGPSGLFCHQLGESPCCGTRCRHQRQPFPKPLFILGAVICILIESDLSLEDFLATVLVFLPGCILLPF